MISELADGAILCNWEYDKRVQPITKITPHQMAARWTGQTCAYYFQNNGISNSANYCIGYEGDIWCNVEEENRAWTSSSSWNDQRAITVEISNSALGTDHMTDESLEAFKRLATDIALRYGIEAYEYTGDASGNFTLHKFYSATPCPGDYFISKIPELIADINERIKNKDIYGNKEKEFSDVKKWMSIYKPVQWAIQYGITAGYDDGTFRPDEKCTRKQFALFLWRLMKKPEPERFIEFKDNIKFGSAAKAIQWAAAEGIVKGYDSGYFGPDDAITRAQAAIMLWRFAKKPQPKTKSPFTDVPEVANSYKAIAWGAENGIMKGFDDGSFKPNQTLTRGQAIIFLYRLANLWK